MAVERLGITYIVLPGQDATGIYEDSSGVEVFETSEPYLLSDGRTLVDPLPVFDAGGPIFQDAMGNAQKALAVSGSGPVSPSAQTWDDDTPWDNDTYWS